VARDGDRDRVASGALDRLAAMGWRRLRWRNLAEDGALRRAVWARREELRFRERVANVCPYARIAGTYEEHLLAVMTTRRRRDVRRCTRAFRDLPDGSVDRIRTPERAGEGVERFLALHARGARRRGGASSVDCEAGRRFHRTLAPRLAADGRLALVFLRQGGRDLACQYDFLLGDKVYGYQGGIDPDSPVPSPGNVLRGIVLAEDVIGAGRTEYDLLEGEEEYKRNWANARRRLFDVEVHRPGPVGRASALLLDAGDALRETWRARREAAVPPAGTQSPEEPSSAV
jgi:CelD/BcsL family acetyltransferase involved in cellulose biosynthesis